jgi:hypothetical protein
LSMRENCSGFQRQKKICVLPLGWFKKHKQHERSLRNTILQRLFRPTKHHKNWIYWQKMLQWYFDFLYCHIVYNVNY